MNISIRNAINVRRNEFVLWTHLGLGDQISVLPSIEMLLRKKKKLHLPVKSINFELLESLFRNEPNIVLFKVPNDKREEKKMVNNYAHSNKIKLVTAGHEMLRGLELLFPKLGINGLLNRACMVTTSNLRPLEIYQRFLSLKQHPIPNEPYALIDHHPGTWREIPVEILTSLKERYLVIENPREIPLFSLASLILEASEIHFVTSAPLCMSLLIRQDADNCFAYCAPPLLKNDYPGWTEIPLPDAEKYKVLQEEVNRAKSLWARITPTFDRLSL